MNWLVVIIIGVIVTGFTMSLMKSASDADDQLLGDKQYEE